MADTSARLDLWRGIGENAVRCDSRWTSGSGPKATRGVAPPAETGAPPWLGCRGPGGVQHNERRHGPLCCPYGGGRAVRCLQSRLRDVLVRPQRITRSYFRPADGQVQRHGPPHVAARRRELHGHFRSCGAGCRCRCGCGSRAARQHGQVRLPRARADAAGADAAGQLAFFVLRTRARKPGIPQ